MLLFCLIGVDDLRARGGRHLGGSEADSNPAPENPQASVLPANEDAPAILNDAKQRQFFLENKIGIAQIRTVAIAFAGISIQSSGTALTESNQHTEFEKRFPAAIGKP